MDSDLWILILFAALAIFGLIVSFFEYVQINALTDIICMHDFPNAVCYFEHCNDYLTKESFTGTVEKGQCFKKVN